MTDIEFGVASMAYDRIQKFISRYGREPSIVVMDECYASMGFAAIEGICVVYTPMDVGILVY